MDIDQLQDRLYWGLNRAANILGSPTDAYRPAGPSDPLGRANRFLKLKAAFSRADGDFSKAVGFDTPVWRGHFDGSYTRVGDYLVQGRGIWFVIAQQSLLPILCVKTNRTVSITRPAPPATGGTYGVGTAGSAEKILSGWPASLTGVGGRGRSSAQLPGETTLSDWTALLPSVHNRVIKISDVVTDEYGTNGAVLAVELTDLGWRLAIRRLST